jgi:phenylalanyl-tRNA synthetase beta chain
MSDRFFFQSLFPATARGLSMKLTLQWIRDYLATDLDAEALSRQLIQIGFDVEEIAPVDGDSILTVDVPSNRPDCLGVLGLARELSARLRIPLRVPDIALKPEGTPVEAACEVVVETPSDCPRYTARLIRGVRVGPSPDWLVSRLGAIGVTPVNNVVDITNYVLYECGQPLHAFDASKLIGQKITVRRGRPGEKMEAINGKTCLSGGDVLVIADAGGPVAFAGVMGGKPTEISPSTRDVLLESAQFDPVIIRRGARKLALESDSSYRFERGVSFDGVEWASCRAAALIEQLANGRSAPGMIDAAPSGRPPRRAIRFRHSVCEKLLGMPCSPESVHAVLSALGCRLSDVPRGETPVDVEVPEHRRDLNREADLIEEVARHVGYDRIPTTPQIPLVLTGRDRQADVESRLRERLVALGYQEVLTPSFGEAPTASTFQLDPAEAVIVLGKQGTPDRPLRQSVTSSLLAILQTNERYGTPLPQIFELATVYGRRGGALAEWPGLGMAVRDDFRALRGHVEALATSVGLSLQMKAWENPPPSWPADRTAVLMLDGVRVGAAAELKPADLKPWDLQHGVCVAELDLSRWLTGAVLQRAVREFSRQPEVQRDLAVIVDDTVSWDRIASIVRDSAPPWMERLEAFDVFRGSQIPAGRKSVAFSMSFRRDDRTLTREEVDGVLGAIVKRLGQDLRATLRT